MFLIIQSKENYFMKVLGVISDVTEYRKILRENYIICREQQKKKHIFLNL